MNRYSYVNKISRWDGKQVYKMVVYPEIPISDNDLYIISNETDYLDTIAFKYYGDVSLWILLAIANNIGKGRMAVNPGVQIRIPMEYSKWLSDFEKANK